MPPLPADSIHARACKLKCEKILTRPHERGHTPAALAGSRRGRPWVSDHAWDVLVSSKNPPKKQGTGKQQMRCLSIPL